MKRPVNAKITVRWNVPPCSLVQFASVGKLPPDYTASYCKRSQSCHYPENLRPRNGKFHIQQFLLHCRILLPRPCTAAGKPMLKIDPVRNFHF